MLGLRLDDMVCICSIIGKFPPKGMNFFDFIPIFAMSVRDYLVFIRNTKLNDLTDMARAGGIFLLLTALEKYQD